MKKIVLTFLIIVLTMPMFSQSVKTTCNWNDAALRIKPNVDSSCIVKVPIGAPIIVIAKVNDSYYKVIYKRDTGYMKISCIIHVVEHKEGYNTNDADLF